MELNFGRIILVGLAFLIFFGVAERVLDRLYLTNKQALLVIAAAIVGSFINIPITNGNIQVRMNVGGFIIPVALAIYILFKAGTTKERVRALIGALVTGTSIFLMGRLLTVNDYTFPIDPMYIYPIIAGLIAYLVGRSRKGAFVAAILGVALFDAFHGIYLMYTGIRGMVHFGGAGVLDGTVLAGIWAVVLAELIGEGRERLQGGPRKEGHDPSVLKNLQATSMIGAEEDCENEEKQGK